MAKKFNKSTLTDIVLKKLNLIQKKQNEFDVFFAGYEKFFIKKSKKYNVPFIQRTKRSSEIDGPASEIYKFFKNLNYDYFFLINSCMPFLRTSTILKYAKLCKKYNQPCFGVFENKNFYLDHKGRPINFDKKMKVINTKNVKILKEFAHCFYFFKKEFFIKNGIFWNWNKVKYINLKNSLEFYDIDDQAQFNLANKISKVIKFV